MVRRECPTFFLICPAARASDGSPAAPRPAVGLQISQGACRESCPRSPPSGGRSEAFLPSIESVGLNPQFLGGHMSRLAAPKPVLDGFMFEGFIEFTADFDRGLVHGWYGSLFTLSSVRQFEAASRDVGLVVKDVVRTLLFPTRMDFSPDVNSAIGEADLFANLRIYVPARRHKTGRNELGADVALA